MHILIIMPSAELHGGAEEALIRLVQEARRTQVCDITIAFLENGELVECFRNLGVAVYVVEAGRLRQGVAAVRCIVGLVRLVRRVSPEVILGWMTKAHIYGGVAGKIARVPAVYFQHGYPDGGVVDRLSQLVPARGALACSEFTATAQRRVVRHRVISVGEPVDLERFSPDSVGTKEACRARLGLPQNRFVVGFVGRLQRWKGVHIFIESVRQIRVIYPSAFGVIVGGAHHLELGYSEQLRNRISELSLSQDIQLAGRQANVQEWMQAMDVVVHASDKEPFGMVVAEAMALGKPVVAAKPGGPEEIVRDGFDGLLVDSGDSGRLTAAIGRLISDHELATRCSQAAMMRAQEFSSSKFFERVLSSIGIILGESRIR